MTQPDTPRRQAKKPSKNRSKLVDAARSLMTEKGYSSVSIDEIVRSAGVTRGALYYQFLDKQDLFAAVCDEIMSELAARVDKQTMAQTDDPTKELRIGCLILLDAYLDEDVRRLLLQEGPVVLGWHEWRARQEPLSIALIEHGLQHLVEEDILANQPLSPIAQLIFGSLTQAGIAIAHASSPKSELKTYRKALLQLLDGIGA